MKNLSNEQLLLVALVVLGLVYLIVRKYKQDPFFHKVNDPNTVDEKEVADNAHHDDIVNRANGYGSAYHIVGEQAYPCSNNPNHLNLYACGVDDYSIWQDGTKADFNHNPVYGRGSSTGRCGLRTHDHAQNPYNYNDLGECRCNAKH